MTVPGLEVPLRTITSSKAFRTGGLALLLVVDLLIIVWMTSSRPESVSLFSTIQAPFADEEAKEDLPRYRQPGRSATGMTEAVVASEPASSGAGADAPGVLLELLGASAKPPFLKTGTPVRAGASSSTNRASATVSASGRGSAPPLVHVPGLPTGVLIPSPSPASPSAASTSTTSSSGLSPALAALLPEPNTIPSVTAGPVLTDPSPTRPPATTPPAAALPGADPTPSQSGPADPSPDPTPAGSDPTPTEDPTPTDPPPDPDPVPTPDPPVDPTPTLDPDPLPTADPVPTSEPTVTATATSTKTPRPRCTTQPCR